MIIDEEREVAILVSLSPEDCVAVLRGQLVKLSLPYQIGNSGNFVPSDGRVFIYCKPGTLLKKQDNELTLLNEVGRVTPKDRKDGVVNNRVVMQANYVSRSCPDENKDEITLSDVKVEEPKGLKEFNWYGQMDSCWAFKGLKAAPNCYRTIEIYRDLTKYHEKNMRWARAILGCLTKEDEEYFGFNKK